MTVFLLLVTTILFAAHWALANRFAVTVKVILRAQAILWFLGYGVRPAYVIATRPGPTSPLADARLTFGDYRDFADVLTVSTVGWTAAVAALWILSLAGKEGASNGRSAGHAICLGDRFNDRLSQQSLWILLAIGWLARALFLLRVETFSLFTVLPTVVICVAFIVTRESTAPIRRWLVVGLVSEGAWTLLFLSKSPLIALVIALSIRILSQSEGRRQTLKIVGCALIATLVFLSVQVLKGVSADEESPGVVPPTIAEATTVSILARSDLISAVSDAYFYPYPPWLSFADFFSSSVLAAMPKASVISYENNGLRWTREVRAQTYPGQYRDVYLSTGPVAEGYVEAGFLGSALEVVAIMLFTVVVGRLLQSRRLAVVLLAGVIAFDTNLFERGVIGNLETVSRALQLMVAGWIVLRIAQLLSGARQIRGADEDSFSGRVNR